MKFKLAFVLLAILIFPFFVCSQSLDENMKPLEPLLHKKWEGKLRSPDGSREFNVIRTYESIFDGKVIKCKKENTDLNNFGEGYFYWNDIEKKIALFFIENTGVFLEGLVNIKGNIIIIEGKMTWPEPQKAPVPQSFNFKNTFEIVNETQMTDKWFQNAYGQWRPGHIIEFRSGK